MIDRNTKATLAAAQKDTTETQEQIKHKYNAWSVAELSYPITFTTINPHI